MEEISFILFKPSGFRTNTNAVYRYIIAELEKESLSIDREYNQHISAWQLCNLWPRLLYDQLLYYTTLEQFRPTTKVIEIKGEDAIRKVKEIKGRVRSLYASSIIGNCIHSPANSQECEAHIKAIHTKGKRPKLEFRQLPYKSYENLTDDLCKELAKFIANISLYAMIPYITPYYRSAKKYRYYLIEDEFHSFADYVCFICDYLPQYSMKDAVVLSVILLAYGEVCITDEDNEEFAQKIFHYGQKHKMTIKCHEVSTLCTL